jgi:hypothetical protein
MNKVGRDKSRMPTNSILYDKVIPFLLIGLTIVTVVCIVIAAGVLLGFVPFR